MAKQRPRPLRAKTRYTIRPQTATQLFFAFRQAKLADPVGFSVHSTARKLAHRYKVPLATLVHNVWHMRTNIVLELGDRKFVSIWDMPGYRLPTADDRDFLITRNEFDRLQTVPDMVDADRRFDLYCTIYGAGGVSRADVAAAIKGNRMDYRY